MYFRWRGRNDICFHFYFVWIQESLYTRMTYHRRISNPHIQCDQPIGPPGHHINMAHTLKEENQYRKPNYVSMSVTFKKRDILEEVFNLTQNERGEQWLSLNGGKLQMNIIVPFIY